MANQKEETVDSEGQSPESSPESPNGLKEKKVSKPPQVPGLTLNDIPAPEINARAATRTGRETIIDRYIKSSNPILEQLTELTRILDNQLREAITKTIANKTTYIRDQFSPEQGLDELEKRARAKKLNTLLSEIHSARLVQVLDFDRTAYQNFLDTLIVPVYNSATKYENIDEEITINNFMQSTDLEKILRLNSFFLPGMYSSHRDKFEDFAKDFFDIIDEEIKAEEYHMLHFLIECHVLYTKETIRIIMHVFNYLHANWGNAMSLMPEKCFSHSLDCHKSVLVAKLTIMQKWLREENFFNEIRDNIQVSLSCEFQSTEDFFSNFEVMRGNISILIFTWEDKLTTIRNDTKTPFSEVAQLIELAFKETVQCLEKLTIDMKEHFLQSSNAIAQEVGSITKRSARKSPTQTSARSAQNSPTRMIYFSQSTDGATHLTPPDSPIKRPNSTQPAESPRAAIVKASSRSSLRESSPAAIDSSNSTHKELLRYLTQQSSGTPVVLRKMPHRNGGRSAGTSPRNSPGRSEKDKNPSSVVFTLNK